MRDGLKLRLLGGLGVRVLCPEFPPRLRPGQDMDLACTGKGRRDVAAYLERSGCTADRMFNSLNGDRQMYFIAPSGRPVDVMVDRLVMCHTLDFRPSFRNSSLTLDPADLLLSKLQIFELNAKDAHDITHLLAGVPVGTAQSGGADGGDVIDTGRFGEVLGADWGWWRTCTGNLEKLPALIAENPGLVPQTAPFDPLAQAAQLLEFAKSVPKGVKWRLRANVGDRVRWYELPEEVAHLRKAASDEDLLRNRHPRVGNLLAQVPQRGGLLQGRPGGARRRRHRQDHGPDRGPQRVLGGHHQGRDSAAWRTAKRWRRPQSSSGTAAPTRRSSHPMSWTRSTPSRPSTSGSTRR